MREACEKPLRAAPFREVTVTSLTARTQKPSGETVGGLRPREGPLSRPSLGARAGRADRQPARAPLSWDLSSWADTGAPSTVWCQLVSATLSTSSTYVNFRKEKGTERPTTIHPRTPHSSPRKHVCQLLTSTVIDSWQSFQNGDTVIFSRFLFSWNQLTSSEAIEVLKNNFYARS